MTTKPFVFPSKPYNPWESYVVEASAGSGKTWQLSRRFLALVMAGADPASILTVTFTKKAASDMRARIIKDALSLGSGAADFAEFYAELKQWCPHLNKAYLKTPAEACEAILEKTQTLKIMTIDSLFFQWCRRYPIETSVDINGHVLESPWTLMGSLETKNLYQLAWAKVLATATSEEDNKKLMASFIANAPNERLRSLLSAISPLIESETFNWYIKIKSGETGLRSFLVDHPPQESDDFIATNEDLFKQVINLASNAEKRELGLRAVQERNFASLVTSTIVNMGRDALNGNTFSKAKKSGDLAFLELNEKLAAWSDHQKIINLNRTGQLLWNLFEARTSAAHKLKIDQRVGGFVDTVKGVSILACNEDFVGARSMAWSNIKHLMLDEFQDTSLLQWLIFGNLAKDILSGISLPESQSASSPSLFIVGDKKQSIYRFREADPEVIAVAKNTLKDFGLKSFQMSESYRSSQLVLDYVNEVFGDDVNIKNFPKHESATGDHYGSLCLYRLTPDANKSHLSSENVPTEARVNDEGQTTSVASVIELEAKIISHHIRACLDGEIPMKISLGQGKEWREPRASDFVVLYAKSTHSQIYEDALRQLNVPCIRSERRGFYNRSEIRDLTALMRWLVWPADNVSLCTILKSPICNLSDQTLQELLSQGADDVLENLKNVSKATWDFLQDLLPTRFDDSVAVLTGKILTKYKITDKYLHAFGPVEGVLAKANIIKWFDEMRSVSSSDAGTIDGALRWVEEKSEEDETGNASLVSDSVTLMTIHKSKGLEFPCVVLAGSSDDWHRDDHGWIKDSRPGQEGFWYIGTSSQRPRNSTELDALLAYNEAESRGEKARLLYVALTRASHHLVITGRRKDDPNAFWGLLENAASRMTNYERQNLNSSEEADGVLIRSLHQPEITRLELEEKQNTPPISWRQHAPTYAALKILTPSQRSQNHTAATTPSRNHPEEPSEISRGLHAEETKAYGTLVHKVIELRLRNQSWSQVQLAGFLQKASGISLSAERTKELVELSLTDTQNLLLSSDIWNKLTADAVEYYCETPMATIKDDALINAVADLIVRRSDGSYRVIDFKTSQVSKENAEDFCKSRGYLAQVKDYCDILKKAYPDANVSGHILFVNPVVVVDL
jgi:ATP-dependent helicase/nuclease subunit A